jgi:hypothetical protein
MINEYFRELGEIDNLAFYNRVTAAFADFLSTGAPSAIRARQAFEINRLIEAPFASSRTAGAMCRSVRRQRVPDGADSLNRGLLAAFGRTRQGLPQSRSGRVAVSVLGLRQVH